MAHKMIIVATLAILGQIATVQGHFPAHGGLRAARTRAFAPDAPASTELDRRGRGSLALVQLHEDPVLDDDDAGPHDIGADKTEDAKENEPAETKENGDDHDQDNAEEGEAKKDRKEKSANKQDDQGGANKEAEKDGPDDTQKTGQEPAVAGAANKDKDVKDAKENEKKDNLDDKDGAEQDEAKKGGKGEEARKEDDKGGAKTEPKKEAEKDVPDDAKKDTQKPSAEEAAGANKAEDAKENKSVETEDKEDDHAKIEAKESEAKKDFQDEDANKDDQGVAIKEPKKEAEKDGPVDAKNDAEKPAGEAAESANRAQGVKADEKEGDAEADEQNKAGSNKKDATVFQQSWAKGDDVDHDMHLAEFFLLTKAETISIFLVWAAVYAGLAFFYHERILHYMPVLDTARAKDDAEGHASFKAWKFGLFALPGQAMEGDGEICLWSCCCPSIRWSDTVSKAGVPFLGAEAGIDSFWRAFGTMSVLYFLFFLPVAGVAVWACVAVFCTHYRMKIREAFKFPEEERSNSTFASDCITYCCCMPCAVAQEARQVHAACIVGHPCIVRPKRAAA